MPLKGYSKYILEGAWIRLMGVSRALREGCLMKLPRRKTGTNRSGLFFFQGAWRCRSQCCRVEDV